VASLLLAGVIITADDRHPGVYNEHIDSSGPVQIDDRRDYIDRHNYGCVET